MIARGEARYDGADIYQEGKKKLEAQSIQILL